MIVAVEAIGGSALGEARASIAAFTVGLLVTFLAVRINTRLIRAKVSWWFHDIESDDGVHVHHMVIGVVLMVAAGLVDMALLPNGLWQQLASFVFGAGVALTLDEFALILRLQDVYRTKEGRLSVDTVIVAACTGLLFVIGYKPFVDTGVTGAAGAVLVAVFFGVNLFFAFICLVKGRLWTGFFGLFIPFVGLVGAIRTASPPPPGRGGATRRSRRGWRRPSPRRQDQRHVALLARGVLRPHRRQAAPAQRPCAGCAPRTSAGRGERAGGCRHGRGSGRGRAGGRGAAGGGRAAGADRSGRAGVVRRRPRRSPDHR